MPAAAFVISPRQESFMRELVETVRYELDLQGIPSTLHTDGFPEPRPDGVYVLAGPRRYIAAEGRAALPDDAILKRTVFLGAEDPDTLALDPRAPGDEPELRLLQRAGVVFDIDVRSVLGLRRAGIAARTLRPGYSRLRDRFDANAERPIDVVFLGARSDRRDALLAAYAPILARHNCVIALTDPDRPDEAPVGPDAKYDLLAQARVVVNLHRGAPTHLEWLRMLEAMHCGAVLVSEHASGLAPFEPGTHLLVAGPESLPFVVEDVLRDTERQQQLRVAAYERLSSWLPFALSISVLRAALVELVGHPVSARADRGRRAVAGEIGSAWLPLRPHRRGLERALAEQLAEARADIVALRGQVAALAQRVAGDPAAPTVRVVHETASAGAVAISAVLAVDITGDASAAVNATLDGFAASGHRSAELIVIATGLPDRARTSIAEWMDAHPGLPARLIVLDSDLGIGGARNVALEHARGAHCLILDPGVQLYPRALDVLVPAVDGVAFAYPIAHHADGLLNAYAWQPERLRLGNYIHAPYLAHVETVQAIGGFTEDPRLRGWEDYDLWCRLAEAGERGRLVPQILARRGVPASPAQLTAGAPEAAAGLAALSERAPGLLVRLGPG